MNDDKDKEFMNVHREIKKLNIFKRRRVFLFKIKTLKAFPHLSDKEEDIQSHLSLYKDILHYYLSQYLELIKYANENNLKIKVTRTLIAYYLNIGNFPRDSNIDCDDKDGDCKNQYCHTCQLKSLKQELAECRKIIEQEIIKKRKKI